MLQGIDVSSFSGTINWAELKQKNPGIDFCFIRAAHGATEDVCAAANLQEARNARIVCGVYHFLRADEDAASQIDRMKSLVAKLDIRPGDLPPVVDVEDVPGNCYPWTPANIAHFLDLIENWCSAMQTMLGSPPIIYISASFWKQLGNPTRFEKNPLWVTEYCHGQPKLPVPWKEFTFWQYKGNVPMAGVHGNADLNCFYSDYPALQAMLLK